MGVSGQTAVRNEIPEKVLGIVRSLFAKKCPKRVTRVARVTRPPGLRAPARELRARAVTACRDGRRHEPHVQQPFQHLLLGLLVVRRLRCLRHHARPPRNRQFLNRIRQQGRYRSQRPPRGLVGGDGACPVSGRQPLKPPR